jgi:hypothetical protein
VVWSMGLAGGVAVVWLVLGAGGPWLGVEGIFPGLVVSGLVLLTGGRAGDRAD